MRFEIRGLLKFSSDLQPAAGEVEELISRSKELLKRGVPEGGTGAVLTGWRLMGKDMELHLESGRHVRAHDALLRIARLMGEELGKRRKIGLRGVTIIEGRIMIPGKLDEENLSRMSVHPFQLRNMEEGIEIKFEGLGESEIRGRTIDRMVSSVLDALSAANVERTGPKVVRRGNELPHPFREDPFEACVREGWITEFPGRGQWIYAEPYAALMHAIEDMIVERIALPMGFREVMLPKLIPIPVMRRMPGYLDSVPEGMYYVCPPPRDPEAFSKFKASLRLTGRIPVDELRKVLKEPSYVLAPAQCEPFYQAFSGRRVRLEDLPLKQYDRSGWTYRWEGGGVEGLIRTQEFRRIEFVFMGSPDDVTSIRDEVVERAIGLMDELGLEWRLLVATPFYLREGETGSSEKAGVATYDLEALLPYSGEWLELGSYNVHRDRFAKSFKIKEVRNRDIWTGCCGFGTSRWVVGFLAQHGLDGERWPPAVRKKVGKLPSAFKAVE
ncbi:MAG: aminoacyl--tRNA ligase-related protein [Candidatus Hadarchaeales archaeon]